MDWSRSVGCSRSPRRLTIWCASAISRGVPHSRSVPNPSSALQSPTPNRITRESTPGIKLEGEFTPHSAIFQQPANTIHTLFSTARGFSQQIARNKTRKTGQNYREFLFLAGFGAWFQLLFDSSKLTFVRCQDLGGPPPSINLERLLFAGKSRKEARMAFLNLGIFVGRPAFFLLNSVFCEAVITFPALRRYLSVLRFSPTSN